jgi:hypothetical protein
MEDPDAARALESLRGQNIHDGCCQLGMEYFAGTEHNDGCCQLGIGYWLTAGIV